MELATCYQSLGLSHSPFQITPDTDFFYPSEDHLAALSHMQYGLYSGGFTLITGEVGLGKTLLCRELINRCENNIHTAYLFNPMQSIKDLLRAIYHDLIGDHTSADSIGELHDAIYQTLLGIASRGERAVLIIDEAHRLPAELLEALRLISNFETEKEKLLSLILVGQPELRKTLALPMIRPLTQRISISYALRPLSMKATMDYIRHRLNHVREHGGFDFSFEAMLLTYWQSKGAPRRINQICDRALLAAYTQQRQTVNGHMILRAAQEVCY